MHVLEERRLNMSVCAPGCEWGKLQSDGGVAGQGGDGKTRRSLRQTLAGHAAQS